MVKKDFYAPKPYFNGLHGVFGDSFVDSWGELLIKRYLATKDVDYNSLSILEKLSIIGNSTVGALTYHPNNGDIHLESEIDLDLYANEASKILNNEYSSHIDDLFVAGGSSGGSRPKIFGKYNNQNVIIKFKSKMDVDNITEQEYEYMMKAKECGIVIPDIYLLSKSKLMNKNANYYAVQRFDIKDNKRLHVISVAGLLECDYHAPAIDYRDLLKLTSILTNSKSEVLQMFKRMVFNVVFQNLDDHAKNFSFFYDEKLDRYCLTPAFDLTKGTTYYGEHTTSVNGKGKNITDEDMIKLAIEFKINKDLAINIINLVKQKYNETKHK